MSASLPGPPSAFPRRLLLGPGPSNVHPRVLAAQARPLLGHLDPLFLQLLDRVQTDLRWLYGSENPLTLPLSATGSGGMEACFANLVESGDRVLIGVAGVFGQRMCEVARRLGADVIAVEAEFGSALDETRMIETIRREHPRLVAFVHAETSTGVLQPPQEIARAARDAGALVLLDCVTSLAGIPLAIDAWGVDAVYSGTQKCLSCPPGLSPASFSARALERVRARRQPCPSWYFDLDLLAGYLGEDRRYHHTAPISAIYALAEGLTLVREEGLDSRFQRHAEAGRALIEGVAELGFQALVPASHRLPMLTTLRLPEHVLARGEAALRRRLLDHYNIEVGGGLGPLAGRIWRIGLMGANARLTNVEALLCALRRELN